MTNLKDSRQLDVLQFIYKEVQEHGYPPTVREICNAVQLSSTSTVHGHLVQIGKKWFIRATQVNLVRSNYNGGLKAIGAKATAIPMLVVLPLVNQFLL